MSKHLSLVFVLSLFAFGCDDDKVVLPPTAPPAPAPQPDKPAPATGEQPARGDANAPELSEFVLGHVGKQNRQYFEIKGQPNTDYSAYSIVLLDGNSVDNPGEVTAFIKCGTTDANGFWASEKFLNEFQRHTETILLVKNFVGQKGDDLDVDGVATDHLMGTIDQHPWETIPGSVDSIVNSVAVSEQGENDRTDNLTYGKELLHVNFDGYLGRDGKAYRVQGASKVNGLWRRNHFFGEGLELGDVTGDENFRKATTLEAVNTPGKVNVMGTEAVTVARAAVAADVPMPAAAPALTPSVEPMQRTEAATEEGSRSPEGRPTRTPAPAELPEQAPPATDAPPVEGQP